MSARMKREILLFGYLLLSFALGLAVGVMFLELISTPLIKWVFAGASYQFPSIERLYRLVKFVAIVAPTCAIVVFIYLKVTSGR
jgi:hypothetical protein